MKDKQQELICELCNKKFKRKNNRSHNPKSTFCTTNCLFMNNLIKLSMKKKLEKYTKEKIDEIIIKTKTAKYTFKSQCQ